MARRLTGGFAAALLLLIASGAAPLPAIAAPASTTGSSISAGFLHSCAVTKPKGTVKCWGSNDAGELGDRSTAASPVPVDVPGLTKITAVTAGTHRTCALSAAGGVSCWGDNSGGQLGNGTTTNSLVPVAVSGLSSGVKAIAAGGNHACALTIAGGVRCWGAGSLGQLGDGRLVASSVPVTPSGLASGVAAISTGAQHSCALTTAGGVKCWGWNNYGETGDGSGSTTTATPVDVPGLPAGIVRVSVGGFHSCAVDPSGTAWCWGQNQVGQLGNGTVVDSSVPVAVQALTGATTMAGGTYHTCALTSSGAARCWGSNNAGQVGDGTTVDRSLPVLVGLPSGAASISAGRFHTCAVTTSSFAWCWGSNVAGQLGNGSGSNSSTPVGVFRLS
jgi:alpha-tubulin suppressor-like RCC1 family protein